MSDNRNTILAVILSGLVLIAWQYFYNVPQMEKQRAEAQRQTELQKPAPKATPSQTTTTSPSASGTPTTTPSTAAAGPVISREAALAAGPRVKIDTPLVTGSISLKGARIDDIALLKFRETVDPHSPPIVLFSPSQTAAPITPSSAGCPRPDRRPASPTRTRCGSRRVPAA